MKQRFSNIYIIFFIVKSAYYDRLLIKKIKILIICDLIFKENNE